MAVQNLNCRSRVIAKFITDNIGFLILLVLLLILMSLNVLTGLIILQEGVKIVGHQLSSLRILCRDLSLSPYEDIRTFDAESSYLKASVDKEGRYVCTAKNITMVINQVTERMKRVQLAQGVGGPRYISCGNESLRRANGFQSAFSSHLDRHQQFSGNESHVILHWNTHTNRSYIDEEMKYNNGEIVIPDGGIYFIYASLTFTVTRSENSNRSAPYRLSLRICRKRYGYEETLAGRVELFHLTDENMFTTLHISTHLRLYKDDFIYVKMSNAAYISIGSTGNTFGIFPF